MVQIGTAYWAVSVAQQATGGGAHEHFEVVVRWQQGRLQIHNLCVSTSWTIGNRKGSSNRQRSSCEDPKQFLMHLFSFDSILFREVCVCRIVK